MRSFPLVVVALLAMGCAGTSVGIGLGGGGFGVGASVSPGQRSDVSPRIYRRMELSDEVCCPPDTILVPPFRGARGIVCLFDTTYVSDDGRMRACMYGIPDEEGGAALVLCVDEELVAATLFVRPIAWEAGGGRLLVREAAADDDLKLFVLRAGDGQFTKTPQERLDTRIGGRGDVYRGWENDVLLLENFTEPGVVRRVAIPDEGDD